MDVVLLGAGRPAKGTQPSALKRIGAETRALDWQIRSFSASRQDATIHYLGGYHVEDVVRAYPQLSFTVISDWARHGALHTLMHAPFGDGEMLVSYSDTIFRDEQLTAFERTTADVVIGVDSRWRERFADRPLSDIEVAETLRLERFDDSRSGEVEFTGLMRFSAGVVRHLRTLDESRVGTNLLHLVDHLQAQGFGIALHDFHGEWAEFNSPGDVARFVLGTKAETLARLQPVVGESRIGSQLTFTTERWQDQAGAIVEELQEHFGGDPVVVRSSSKTEDGWQSSNAGGYESRLDVDSASAAALREAVEAVIGSYSARGRHDDQVLVQPFIQNVECAGVVFTCSLETGAPYYRFNFDDLTKSTDSVTSGVGETLRTVIVSRHHPDHLQAIEPVLMPVLRAVQELERVLGFDRLDIEFAIDRNHQVHIFQVRPITVDHAGFETEDGRCEASLAQSVKYFLESLKPRPFVVGDRTLYGNMPDWNPAEIIGTRPKPLAFSLYRSLITDRVWAQQRAEFGYRDVRPHPLLVGFAGQPYVDLRASFNSFIPASVPDALARKLVNAYIAILDANPDLHDKIEFEVAFTAWTPDLAGQAGARLGVHGVTAEEVSVLEEGLKDITRRALLRLEDDIRPLRELTARREWIEASAMLPIERAMLLLDDCRRLGTIAFAHAARAGFVATTFLKSFRRLGIFSADRELAFMNSVATVAKDFEEAKQDYTAGRRTKQDLVRDFGHLRPGTYEIEVPAYWEDPARFLLHESESGVVTPTFELDASEAQQVRAVLADLGSGLSPAELMAYLRAAIEAREAVKFEFTRNLSRALDCLALLAEGLGLGREELAFLSIEDIENLRGNLVDTSDLARRIERNRDNHKLTHLLELPPLITSANDFYCFEQRRAAPNYVTNLSVEANLCLVADQQPEALRGRIALIPRADPGFDWLFGAQIAGLVTMYGGANSHMAIRSAELGLPAVIGVGENRFEALKRTPRAFIDCASQLIRAV